DQSGAGKTRDVRPRLIMAPLSEAPTAATSRRRVPADTRDHSRFRRSDRCQPGAGWAGGSIQMVAPRAGWPDTLVSRQPHRRPEHGAFRWLPCIVDPRRRNSRAAVAITTQAADTDLLHRCAPAGTNPKHSG
ncbi:MAG: hypothetical protein L0312_13235, partial [Acidobacteria bacterium]|nr:hypothetical protein [Acidobacteriota bacterium]